MRRDLTICIDVGGDEWGYSVCGISRPILDPAAVLSLVQRLRYIAQAGVGGYGPVHDHHNSQPWHHHQSRRQMYTTRIQEDNTLLLWAHGEHEHCCLRCFQYYLGLLYSHYPHKLSARIAHEYGKEARIDCPICGRLIVSIFYQFLHPSQVASFIRC